MTPLALEYQACRREGYSAVACIQHMLTWRQRVIDRLLACADSHGLPEHVQTLVIELQGELTALSRTLEKAAHAA